MCVVGRAGAGLLAHHAQQGGVSLASSGASLAAEGQAIHAAAPPRPHERVHGLLLPKFTITISIMPPNRYCTNMHAGRATRMITSPHAHAASSLELRALRR